MRKKAINRFWAGNFVGGAFVLLSAFSLKAQPAEPAAGKQVLPSLFDFFYQQADTLPLLQIDTDWGRLIRTKQHEEYQKGVLRFQGQDGNEVELEVELRARGNTRKKVCLLPPVKVKAAKQQLKELGFNPEYKLKFVLPCQDGKMQEDCLLREALAYQLWELAGPVYFRTKLLKLQCWQEGREKHTLYAFLVEEEDELAARLNGRVLPRGKIQTVALERSLYLRMCFFQYMIANTDWSVASRHNIQFLQLPGYARVVAVPYDFDYAGLVNATYAIPGSTVPIDDVSERYFLGQEVTEEEALECSRFFLSRKEQILQHCRSFNLMRERSRDSALGFLSEFFMLLEDEELTLKTFTTKNVSD